MKDMKKNIKNLMFFIVSSLIITLVFSSVIQGSSSVVNLSKNVYLTDKAIEKEVILYNFLNEATEFNIKLNTTPFKSELSKEKVLFLPNQTKRIKYTIYPLDNSEEVEYTGSIEVSFANNNYTEYFTINQEFNKKCDVSLEVNYSFLENNELKLNMLFINPTEDDQNIVVRDVNGVIDFSQKEITVLNNSDFLLESIVSLEKNELTIEYVCNNILNYEQIEIKRDINFLSGFITFKNLDNFLESVYFKILLIVLLIVLVLSFSTRYLRHINKK
jgi:hypothetical protein